MVFSLDAPHAPSNKWLARASGIDAEPVGVVAGVGTEGKRSAESNDKGRRRCL
jgi:hypothetical protein